MGNVAEAMDWAVRTRRSTLGITLAALAWQHWRRRGAFRQGRAWLEELTKAGELSNELRGKGLSILGGLAWQQDDFAAADVAFSEALTAYEAAGLKERVVGANNNLGLVASCRHDFVGARTYFQAARDGFIALGQPDNAASAAVNLGMAELEIGNYESAEECFREALPQRGHFRSDVAEPNLLCNFAHLCILTGRPVQALNWAVDAAECLHRNPTDVTLLPSLLAIVSCLCVTADEMEKAAVLFGAEKGIRLEYQISVPLKHFELLTSVEEKLSHISDDQGIALLRKGSGLKPVECLNYARDALSQLAATAQFPN